MKTTHILLATCLFLAPCAVSANAQSPPRYENEAEFSLQRYSPKYVFAESLFGTLDEMYGRNLIFEDRSVNNLILLDDSVVIYETSEHATRILEAINQLDTRTNEDDPSGQGDSSDENYSPDQMTIESYVPMNFPVPELFDLASDLYGGGVTVNGEWYENIRLTSQSILIYEPFAAAQELLAKLEKLDASQAPEQVTANFVTLEYRPRHVSANGLMEGILPFRTSRFVSNTVGNMGSMNISLMSEQGVIIIHDHEKQAKEIMSTLERLDQPSPQVMVVCQVIRGIHLEANEKIERPANIELQDQLRQLLPHDGYAVEVNGMLRGSTAAGTRMELKMVLDDEGNTEYRFEMLVGAFDPKSGALDLEACELSVSGDELGTRKLFRTSTTIYAGEYAVIGVTGTEPLFLVVQMHPVKAPQ